MRVWLEAALARQLHDEADRAGPDETGGILLGWTTDHDIVVTHVVGPGPTAVHRRTRFEPDSRWQAEEVARLYAEAGRTLTYLGDWHTHPGGVPRLSRRDRATLRTISRDPGARNPRPMMLVMAPADDGSWRIATATLLGRRRGLPSGISDAVTVIVADD